MDDWIRAAICRIDILQDGVCVSRGSGALVAPGIVLTAFHVVGDRKSDSPAPYPGDIVVTFPGGAGPGTLFAPHFDSRADWALVQLKTQPGITPIPLASNCAKGLLWESYGWPDANSRDGLTHTGTVSNERGELDGNRVLQLFCDQAAAGSGEKVRGLSGGPILVQNALAGVMRFALMTDGRTEAGTLYGVPADVVAARCAVPPAAVLPMPDPCYGLPGLPAATLPDDPFRYLARFTEKDAEIFFGRKAEIRELYAMVTADDQNPLILLYGQSGVGKSSFLDAGLVPRLKWYHQTRYVRRDASRSLTETLIATLGGSPAGAEPASLCSAWETAEQAAGKPLIVVFDQLEEVFSQPNPLEARELEHFVEELGRAFGGAPGKLRGKLILSFRKEWFPEIQKQVESTGLAYLKLFLEAMSRDAVVDCVNGLASTDRLRQKYNLRVEESLPLSIANDLLADTGSPVAPTLQILLTNLWAAATAANGHQPDFSVRLYTDLKQKGMLLGDFLDHQLEALRKDQETAVSSGLALDILMFHTTSTMTVQQRTHQEVLAAYGENRAGELQSLMDRCVELALLVDSGGDSAADRGASRLSHDTLAPFVHARYGTSTLVGPRARRIVEGSAAEWNGIDEAPLEAWELKIVEAGAASTRVFDEKQQRLIAQAREISVKRTRQRRIIRFAFAALALLIVASLISVSFFWKHAAAQRDLAELYHEYSTTLDKLDSDPLVGLAKAVAAARTSLDSQDRVLSELQLALGGALDQAREVYVNPGNSPIQAVSIGRQTIVEGRLDGTLRLHGMAGDQAQEFAASPNSTSAITGVCFSPDGSWFVSSDADGYLTMWDRNGQRKRDLLTPPVPKPESGTPKIQALAVTPDGASVVSGWTDASIRIVPVFPSETSPQKQAFWKLASLGSDKITALATIRDQQGEIVVAAGNSSGEVALWNLSKRKLLHGPWRTAHKTAVTAIDLTEEDGTSLHLVTGSANGAMNQWKADGTAEYTAIELHSPVNAIRYDPSGKLMAAAEQSGFIHLLYRGGMDFRPPFAGFRGPVTSLAFDPESLSVIGGSGDGSLRVVEMVGVGIGVQIPTDGTRVGSLVFSPDGKLLAGSSKRHVYLWDFARDLTARPISLRDSVKLEDDNGAALAIDPQGRWLAIANNSALRLWDLHKDTSGGRNAFIGQYPMDCKNARSIAFNSDGSLLAIGGECDTVDLFDTKTWSVLARIPADHRIPPQHGVTRALVFAPNDRFLFTTGDDAKIRRWPLTPGQIASAGAGTPFVLDNKGMSIYALAFSPKGETLLSGDWSGVISRWSNWSRQITHRDQFQAQLGAIQNIRVHPLGEAIYTSSDSGDLRVLSQRTWARLFTLPYEGEAKGLFGMALSADGKTLASGNGAGYVKLWRAHWTDLAEAACRRLEQHPRFKARQQETGDAKTILEDAADACESRFWEDSKAKVVYELPPLP
jgi:WD40 repeat protein